MTFDNEKILLKNRKKFKSILKIIKRKKHIFILRKILEKFYLNFINHKTHNFQATSFQFIKTEFIMKLC